MKADPALARHFRNRAARRRGFDKHHASAAELWVACWKFGSGRPSVTWPGLGRLIEHGERGTALPRLARP